MVWMLRYYGHDDASILAGGIRDWAAAGQPLVRDVPTLAAQHFHAAACARNCAPAKMKFWPWRKAQVTRSYSKRNATEPMRRAIATSKARAASLHRRLLEDARGGRIASAEQLRELTRGLDPRQTHDRFVRQRRRRVRVRISRYSKPALRTSRSTMAPGWSGATTIFRPFRRKARAYVALAAAGAALRLHARRNKRTSRVAAAAAFGAPFADAYASTIALPTITPSV